jgi:hypothetical protein
MTLTRTHQENSWVLTALNIKNGITTAHQLTPTTTAMKPNMTSQHPMVFMSHVKVGTTNDNFSISKTYAFLLVGLPGIQSHLDARF